ncbi:hypothetical protein UlMin_011580 [Ulmus minor]
MAYHHRRDAAQIQPRHSPDPISKTLKSNRDTAPQPRPRGRSCDLTDPKATQPQPARDHPQLASTRRDLSATPRDSPQPTVTQNRPLFFLTLYSIYLILLSNYNITILYFAKKEPDSKFVSLYPDAFMPKFHQPSGIGIELGFFELDDLAKTSSNEDVFPLVISTEINPPTDSVDGHLNGPVQDRSSNLQITQAMLEKRNTASFHVKVIRQVLSAAEGIADNDSGMECVICMTEPKDTFVLPCRHMCMCNECAKELRLQTNKCLICCQPIKEIVGIKINNGDQ